MAKKEITSRPGLFGTTSHYDSRGRQVGESRPGLFGTTNHYDANGKKVGSSSPGLFGSTNLGIPTVAMWGIAPLACLVVNITTIGMAIGLVEVSLVYSGARKQNGTNNRVYCHINKGGLLTEAAQHN